MSPGGTKGLDATCRLPKGLPGAGGSRRKGKAENVSVFPSSHALLTLHSCCRSLSDVGSQATALMDRPINGSALIRRFSGLFQRCLREVYIHIARARELLCG